MDNRKDNSIYERLSALLDNDSLVEIDKGAVITASGMIDGRTVFVFAHDSSISGGAVTADMADSICRVMDMAITKGAPLICLNSSAGAHIHGGLAALEGLGAIFSRHMLASERIPQISGIFGPCAGGAVYSPALTDFTVMVRDSSYMYVTGPAVVRKATGECVSHEELGGADIHSKDSGAAHFAADSEADGLRIIRELVSYLPSDSTGTAPLRQSCDPVDRKCISLNSTVPADHGKPYDMKEVIREMTDDGVFLETHDRWAGNLITCFAHMGGHAVGIVANQPNVMAGAIDGNASRKAAGFIDFCSRFNIPLISLTDTPGYLCGSRQEKAGIITHGAGLIRAYGKAETLKIAVNLRKAYGGAYITMSSRKLGSDVNLAWPGARYGVMGDESAAEVLHSGKAAEDRSDNLQKALEDGFIDAVIQPEDTRFHIIRILERHYDIS